MAPFAERATSVLWRPELPSPPSEGCCDMNFGPLDRPLQHVPSSTPTLIKAWIFFFMYLHCFSLAAANKVMLLEKGFKMSADSQVNYTLPILSSQNGSETLNLVHVNQHKLALAILHWPSGKGPLACSQGQVVSWTGRAELIFNGSLSIIDSSSGAVLWSTGTDGDQVVLSGGSLQIRKGNITIWQSPTPSDDPSRHLLQQHDSPGRRLDTFGPMNFEHEASVNSDTRPPRAGK